MANINTIRGLKARNTRLERELLHLNAALTKALEERDEAVEDSRRYKDYWQKESAHAKNERERADKYEGDAGALRMQLSEVERARFRVERSLTAARTHAEQMRATAYPRGPVFPWERVGG